MHIDVREGRPGGGEGPVVERPGGATFCLDIH